VHHTGTADSLDRGIAVVFPVLSSHTKFSSGIDFTSHILKESNMLTLYVEGVPAIKLGDKSEIPAAQGSESWRVVDAKGKTIAAYL
jgi:hypothetical protein